MRSPRKVNVSLVFQLEEAGRVYVAGYCREREGNRVFALDLVMVLCVWNGTPCQAFYVAFHASKVQMKDMANIQPINRQRFVRLSALSPVEAVQAWLDGDFGMGDEPALISAIRKDRRISLPDEDLEDAILEAMDEGLDARVCLERLAGSR